MSLLRAGAARVKLDPPGGLAMLGYGGRVGPNNGVHDDLAAQALVLDDGISKIAIAGVDLLAIGARIADDIRERVAARTGIPADSVLICATHTHSAPAFNIFATPRADTKPAEGRDLDWERAIPEKIASAIVQANERLEPATLRAATAPFTLGINRRLKRPLHQVQTAANRAGPADAQVIALGAYRPNGTPIAFLMNYPCHGVVLCEDNLLYSRDWPGFAMDEIESAAASPDRQGPISIFIQGATGNIDPRSRGNFEVAEQHGRAMGRAAFDALAHAPLLTAAQIAARRIPLRLKLKDISADLAVARACAAQTQASLDNHRGGDGYQLKRLRDHHAQSLSALAALEALEGAKPPRPPRRNCAPRAHHRDDHRRDRQSCDRRHPRRTFRRARPRHPGNPVLRADLCRRLLQRSDRVHSNLRRVPRRWLRSRHRASCRGQRRDDRRHRPHRARRDAR